MSGNRRDNIDVRFEDGNLPENMSYQGETCYVSRNMAGAQVIPTLECEYLRNPFNLSLQVASSEDVLCCVSQERKLREVPNGQGTLSFVYRRTSYRLYSGFFFNGKRKGTGEGHIIAPCENDIFDGYYSGGWANNMRHGSGVMAFLSGDVYDGEWDKDKMNGVGVLKLTDGTIRRGRWVEGVSVNWEVFQGEDQQSWCRIGGDMAKKLNETCLIGELLRTKVKLYRRNQEYEALSKAAEEANSQAQEELKKQG